MRNHQVPFAVLLVIAMMACTTPASASDAEVVEDETNEDPEAFLSESGGVPPEESPSKTWGLTSWNRFEGYFMTLSLGALVIVDYNTFGQDVQNVAQVGSIPSETELRAGRLMLRGALGRKRRVSYFYAGEYNGLSREPGDSALRMTDLAFNIDIHRVGELTIGLTKEPISLARIMPGDGVLLMERATNDALVPSRNTGFKLANTALNQHLTWQIGWFNDWFVSGESLGDSDNQFVGRVTGTPIYRNDGRSLIHLGLAGRYAEPENGTFRYRQRPEANTAPLFVDTGAFEAESSKTLGIELAGIHEGWSFQGELLKTDVRSATAGDPQFFGWYIAGSWILTGESRSYSRRGGFFYKLIPDRPFTFGERGPGAWELTARYSDIDLDDGLIRGGQFRRWSVGVNWFLDLHWRLEVNYGQGILDRFGTSGRTRFLQFRLQWLL
jgi:phosphate-selective porin OprO/OprP